MKKRQHHREGPTSSSPKRIRPESAAAIAALFPSAKEGNSYSYSTKAGMRVPKLVVFDLDNCCWDPEMYQMRDGSPFQYNEANNTCKASRSGETVRLLGDIPKIWGALRWRGTFGIFGPSHFHTLSSLLVSIGYLPAELRPVEAGRAVEGVEWPTSISIKLALQINSRNVRRQRLKSKPAPPGDYLRQVNESSLLSKLEQQKSPWLAVSFHDAGTKIAIASCCDEPSWAHELLGKFRIGIGATGGGTGTSSTIKEQPETMRDAVTFSQIHYGAKTGHFNEIKRDASKVLAGGSKLEFSDMIFFDDQSGHIRNVGNQGVVAVQTPHGGVTWSHFFAALGKFA